MISREFSVPRIVLDTNVCLDLLLFRDPSCDALMAALRAGAVQAVSREDCRDEWQRVLHYPQLPVEASMRPRLCAEYDELLPCLPSSAWRRDDLVLPLCGDPDDQKFLELAHAARASWLLSKDKELLKLHRRTQAAGLFAILLPPAWSLDLR
jgi:putative PIN family toxin of toxin-antitoxin system